MIKTQIKNEKLFILYPKNCLRFFSSCFLFFLLGGRFTDLLLLVLVHYLLIGLMILAGLEFSKTKSKIRKRIETNISQLCGQFSINIKFAKTFQGLITRITSKITSFTMIQYLNFFIFKRSLNKLKINVC